MADALGLDVHVLADGRGGRRVEPLGERLVVDLRDVVHADAALAVGGVEELAALRQFAAVGGPVLVGRLEDALVGEVILVVLRVGELVEMAADGGLRFLGFGPHDRADALLPAPTHA